MLKQSGQVLIHQPSARVFEFLADPTKASEWQSGIAGSTILTPGPIQIGSQFKDVFQFPLMGRFEVICEITHFEPHTAVGWKSVSVGKMSYEGVFTLEAANGGTQLLYRGSSQFGGLWRLLEPLMAGEIEREVQTELNKIKTVLES